MVDVLVEEGEWVARDETLGRATMGRGRIEGILYKGILEEARAG